MGSSWIPSTALPSHGRQVMVGGVSVRLRAILFCADYGGSLRLGRAGPQSGFVLRMVVMAISGLGLMSCAPDGAPPEHPRSRVRRRGPATDGSTILNGPTTSDSAPLGLSDFPSDFRESQHVGGGVEEAVLAACDGDVADPDQPGRVVRTGWFIGPAGEAVQESVHVHDRSWPPLR